MNIDDMTQREQLALISTASAPPLTDAITTWRDTAKWAWDTADQIEQRLQRLLDPHEGWTGSGAEAFAKVVRTELIDNLRSYAAQAGGHTTSGTQHSGYDAKLQPVLEAVKGSHATATKNNVPWDVDPQWQADIPPKPDDDDKPKPGEAAKPAEPVKIRNGHGGVVIEVDKDRWKALLQANPQTAVPAIFGTAGIAVSPQTHRADRLFEALQLNSGPKAEVRRGVQAVLKSLDTFAPEKVKAANTSGKDYAQGATGGAGGVGGGGGTGGYPGGTGGTGSGGGTGGGYPGGTGHTGDPGPYPGGGTGHPGDPAPYPGGGTGHPGDPAPYPGGGTGHPGDPAPYPGGGGPGDPAPYPPGTPVHTGPTGPIDPGSGYGGYHHGTVGAGAGAGGIGGAGVPAGAGVGAGAAGGTVSVGSPGASGLGSFGGAAGAPGTSFATGPDGRASVNPGNVGRLGGAGAGGAGSGGTGGVAPMPRRSSGSDEDEERTEADGTWLEEDDSVWGNRAGAPPAEIR